MKIKKLKSATSKSFRLELKMFFLKDIMSIIVRPGGDTGLANVLILSAHTQFSSSSSEVSPGT